MNKRLNGGVRDIHPNNERRGWEIFFNKTLHGDDFPKTHERRSRWNGRMASTEARSASSRTTTSTFGLTRFTWRLGAITRFLTSANGMGSVASGKSSSR